MLSLIQSHPASLGPHPGAGQAVGVTVINYNTSAETLRCITSLGACTDPPAWIEVLDNASRLEDFAHLQTHLPALPHTRIRLHRSDSNLGFAAGSNRLCEQLLQEPDCRFIGLLNNDAVAQTNWVSELVNSLQAQPLPSGMAGGRMHKLNAPDQVDTLGICLYASLMPADRQSTTDPYLGPTGGCCLMTRAFVEDIVQTTGYLFDERFFCYCEDTDLAVRANLLGYRPGYTDQLIALHEGQASSKSGHNQFIAFHGIRNMIWMQFKLIPSSIVIQRLHWLLIGHIMTISWHCLLGHPRLMFIVYQEAFSKFSTLRIERSNLITHHRISHKILTIQISKKFYRQGYIRKTIARIFQPS